MKQLYKLLYNCNIFIKIICFYLRLSDFYAVRPSAFFIAQNTTEKPYKQAQNPRQEKHPNATRNHARQPSAIPITPTPARAFFLQLNAIPKTQPPPRTPKSKQPETIYIYKYSTMLI